MKICKNCKENKELDQFKIDKRGYIDLHCKICRKAINHQQYLLNKDNRLKYRRIYYNKHKRDYDQYHKKYYLLNKDYKLKLQKKRYIKNKKEITKRNRQYYQQNKKEIINFKINKYRKDKNFKLKSILRSRLYSAIKNQTKIGSAVKDLCCTIEELKQYLEIFFYDHPDTEEKMTWDNYGPRWHIDHIKPLASFDLTNREEFLKAVCFINLQPLWAEHNWEKNDSLNWNLNDYVYTCQENSE